MPFPPVADQLALILRGVEEVISRPELEARLTESHKTGKPLRVKLGVDPTARSLHLGFTVGLRKLRQFQDLGHKAVLIIGDYTAQVGDPSGRNKTRPQITEAEVRDNSRDYLSQAGKILDIQSLEVRSNGEWFSAMSFLEVIGLCSKMTVARMLERDDFEKRFRERVPISLHEFIYPLMQGHDSIAIQSDIELGGTDQLFNVLVGRGLQKDAGLPPQICLTFPLLVGTDGVKKMSKSYDNYIAIDESPKSMYDKILSIPDSRVENYWTLLTDLPLEKVSPFPVDRAREIKEELACDIVRQYHGREVAEQFRTGRFVYPEYCLPRRELDPRGTILPQKLLVLSGLAPSSTKARQFLTDGAVRLAGEKIASLDPLVIANESLLQCGKANFRRIRLVD